MAEFFYRGKNPEKLTREEFLKLLPSGEKRKVKRGFTEQEKKLLKKIAKFEAQKGKKLIKTHCREMIILPEMIGHKLGIHKGKDFFALDILPEYVGHRLGEFAPGTVIVKHGAAGIGASHGTKFSATKK
ncbi:MAG: ribosomal protein S19 family protein [Candidatus Aenigmarchaeota archaeon]|nr:ribosomal protein S19 family protein [Candidatus Aenigmarchaeota archaeon]